MRLDLAAAGAVERARLHAPACRFALDAEPCLVRAAPARLDRAIANLLDNAVKWGPPSAGPVEVRVRDGRLEVRDHGPGIAAEDLPRVFDRFYRAPAARGLPGSGLGLAIVRQVAETHGGSGARRQRPGRRRAPDARAAGRCAMTAPESARQPGPRAARAPFSKFLGSLRRLSGRARLDVAQAADRSRSVAAPSPRPRPSRKGAPCPSVSHAPLAAACAVGVSLLLAACGGSRRRKRRRPRKTKNKLVKFAKCMREHGVNATTSTGAGGGRG